MRPTSICEQDLDIISQRNSRVEFFSPLGLKWMAITRKQNLIHIPHSTGIRTSLLFVLVFLILAVMLTAFQLSTLFRVI